LPDLPSSHYAKTAVDYFREEKLKFVETIESQANPVPEARPIEEFWSILKCMKIAEKLQ